MNPISIEVNSVQQYIAVVIELYNAILHTEDKKNKKHLFFRGLPDRKYQLIPSVFRREFDERTIVLDFNHNAAVLGVKYNFPDDIDKMLAYMQEYGLPTRLLDWTIAPLNALYFACSAKKEVENLVDGRVVVLNPWKLWKEIINNPYRNIPLIHIANIKARALLSLGWEWIDINKFIYKKFGIVLPKTMLDLPFPFIISYDNPRILHQRGAFTIHGMSEKKCMEGIEVVKECILKEIIIKAEQKRKILKELNFLYINHYSIFPDAEGMKELIKRYGSLFNLK